MHIAFAPSQTSATISQTYVSQRPSPKAKSSQVTHARDCDPQMTRFNGLLIWSLLSKATGCRAHDTHDNSLPKMSMSYFPEHVSALYDRKKELKKVEFKLLILQP